MFAKLNAYCLATYGASLLAVDPTAALWVAEHFGGWATWRTVAAKRNKAGKGTAFPVFGSACWE